MNSPRTGTQGISQSTRSGKELGHGKLDESQGSDPVFPSQRPRSFQQGTVLETAGRVNVSCPVMSCTREAVTPEKGGGPFTWQRYSVPPTDEVWGCCGNEAVMRPREAPEGGDSVLT